jgi:hypothetical protein
MQRPKVWRSRHAGQDYDRLQPWQQRQRTGKAGRGRISGGNPNSNGDARIFGVMIESHLKAGRQDLMPGKELVYGLSITDACVGWEDTRKLVEDLADAVRQRRVKAEAEGEAE